MSLSCPNCSSTRTQLWCTAKDYEYFTSEDIFEYYYCDNCDTIFLNPAQIKPLAEIYPTNYYAFKESGSSILQGIKMFLDKRLFKRIVSKIEGPQINVLDVGGGTGWLLDTVRQIDSRVTVTQVVDIDHAAQKLAEQRGHRYFCGRIEDFATDQKFHFVLLLNLIEHVANPGEVLSKIEGLLAPGGVILIKTPNIDSWDARRFRTKYWGGLHAPRHWVLFSAKSFALICKQSRLRIRSLKYTQGAPFWAFSILSDWYERKWIKITPEEPLPYHPMSAPIMAIMAVFDIIRGMMVKTSQMFLVIEKEKQIEKEF